VLALALLLTVVAGAHENGWLLFNAKASDSVMVSDPVEKQRLLLGPWQIDGRFQFLQPTAPGAKALHRLARRVADGTDRKLAADPDEIRAQVDAGFTDEGVVGFVATEAGGPSREPVYRFTKGERSLWLMGEAGCKWAREAGWQDAGAAFWVEHPDRD
jgi:hypothetical protein